MKPNRKPLTQRKVAELVDIRPDFFNHILTGRCPCPPSVALKLEKVTGIDRGIWVWGTPKEKRTAWLLFQIESQNRVDSSGKKPDE